MCAPFFCFFMDSNQRQAAPNLHDCKFGKNSPVDCFVAGCATLKSNQNGILPYLLRSLCFLNWTRTTTAAPNLHYCKFGRNNPVNMAGGRLPPLRGHFCIQLTVGADSIRPLFGKRTIHSAGASPRPTINTFRHKSHCIIPRKSAYTSIGDCMKNKIVLQWCGFAFVSIVGTLWHFIYQWTGNNRLVAPVCPVNESPWEHLKLLWFPFLLWCLINLRSTKGQSGAWARHCVGAIAGIGVITAVFFTYKGIIGRDIMALDIISFILGVGNAFWLDAVLTRNGKLQGKSAQTAGIFLLLAVSALFMLFTFYPPRIPWFLDEQSGIYGI